jgi:hypothetical protein
VHFSGYIERAKRAYFAVGQVWAEMTEFGLRIASIAEAK